MKCAQIYNYKIIHSSMLRKDKKWKQCLIIKKTENGTLTQPSITKQLQIMKLLFIFGTG